MDIRKYYRDIKDLEERITRDVLEGKLPHMPNPITMYNGRGDAMQRVEAVFCTSIENEDRCITGGAVAMGPLTLVAQKICDKTHRLSTPEEVSQYRVDNARRLAERHAADAKSEKRFTVNLPGTEPVQS